MKYYEVSFSSEIENYEDMKVCPQRESFIDVVICKYPSDIASSLKKRGYKEVIVSNYKEIEPQTIKVKDLTVGDLVSLMKGVQYENKNSMH